ncbi:MAG: PASTA domain-containing protein [Solirubrobacteraceae bacterium]
MINIFGEMNGNAPLQWYAATNVPPPAQGWATQASQDLSAVETASEAGGTSAESIGEGMMGAGADGGFLASAGSLVSALGPVGLAAADATLLIHDGTLLFDALFGSAAPPQTYTLMGWETYGGSIASSWQGPDSAAAEKAMGASIWNAPGWLAQWGLGYNNLTTEVNMESPSPSEGTRVNFKSSWGEYTYYLLARDVPGAVSNWDPSADQADFTLTAPNVPKRGTAVSKLNSELARPEYHTLRLELQHLLDPRCSPDPLSSTVTVPAVLDGETSDDYAQCLSRLGLHANVTTLAETDLSAANGGVTETNPEAGTSVQPGATVDVAANPQQPQVSQADPRCDVNNGSGSIGDPGNPPADGTDYPAYQLVQNSPYQATIDPTGSSSAQTQIPLRWGTTGWGWRHTLQKHTYTIADEQQTMQALATDTNPTPGFASTNQWDFHLFFTEPDGSGGTIACVRTVRVEYYQDLNAARVGVQGIRGIQNSYAGLYLGGIPGH